MTTPIKNRRSRRLLVLALGLVLGIALLSPDPAVKTVVTRKRDATALREAARYQAVGRTPAWSGAAARMPPASARVSSFLSEHPPTAELRTELTKLVELSVDGAGDGREEFRKQLKVALLAMTPTERAAMRLQRLNIVQIARQLSRTTDPS